MNKGQNGTDERASAFSRNSHLEELLQDINSSLWISEREELQKYHEPEMPIVLIMGPMRSGTTLFLQWLANSDVFGYPTNLLSRFYRAPIIGAKIQLLLTDARYSFRNELGDFLQSLNYSSENGKTQGVLAPNEFWYFWRRFLSEPGRDVWTDEELQSSMDKRTLLAELSGIIDILQKPFAAKGMLFNYNIPFLDSLLDKAVFVQIKRDPATNVASVIEARKRQFGNEAQWYSFQIPEYQDLKGLDPIAQVAGQVHYINEAVSKGMAEVDSTRKIVVRYEDFCADPGTVFAELSRKVGIPDSQYTGPSHFKPTRKNEIQNQAAIENAVLQFSEKSR